MTPQQTNSKPWLLIMKMSEEIDSWYYIRMSCPSHALFEVSKAEPIEWTVCKDIRRTLADFHSQELVRQMREEQYKYGTWLKYAESNRS